MHITSRYANCLSRSEYARLITRYAADAAPTIQSSAHAAVRAPITSTTAATRATPTGTIPAAMGRSFLVGCRRSSSTSTMSLIV